jgi:hypothetical protein
MKDTVISNLSEMSANKTNIKIFSSVLFMHIYHNFLTYLMCFVLWLNL